MTGEDKMTQERRDVFKKYKETKARARQIYKKLSNKNNMKAQEIFYKILDDNTVKE